MIILSMNIRGVGDDLKKGWIKRPCHEYKIQFLGVQETSTSMIDRRMILSIWNNSNFDFVFKKSVGKSGGILAVLDSSRFTKHSYREGDGYLAVKGTWLPIDLCLSSNCDVCTAMHPYSKKLALWNAINDMTSRNDCLTIIFGDFNEVRYATERSATNFCERGANLFNDFISTWPTS